MSDNPPTLVAQTYFGKGRAEAFDPRLLWKSLGGHEHIFTPTMQRVVAEPADHVDHASARRHAREAATTEAWWDSEE